MFVGPVDTMCRLDIDVLDAEFHESVIITFNRWEHFRNHDHLDTKDVFILPDKMHLGGKKRCRGGLTRSYKIPVMILWIK